MEEVLSAFPPAPRAGPTPARKGKPIQIRGVAIPCIDRKKNFDVGARDKQKVISKAGLVKKGREGGTHCICLRSLLRGWNVEHCMGDLQMTFQLVRVALALPSCKHVDVVSLRLQRVNHMPEL